MGIYIRRAEIVDEFDNVVMKINHLPAEKGVKLILERIQTDENPNVFSKILRYLDKDAKKLFNVEDEDENK